LFSVHTIKIMFEYLKQLLLNIFLRWRLLKFVCLQVFVCCNLLVSAQNTIVWADSCLSNTFKGNIQTTSPNGLSVISQVLNYPGGDMICVGRIRPVTGNNVPFGSYGLIMRVSKTGIVIWSRFISYGSMHQEADIVLNEGFVTGSGDIVTTSDDHLIKLDGNGNLLWSKKLIEFTQFRSFQQMRETSDGGILAAGVTGSATLIAKFDAQGLRLWSKFYHNGVMAGCNSIVETPQAYFFIARARIWTTPVDSSFNILARISKADGTLEWAKALAKTANPPYTEHSYDDIQFINNKLVISGFSNYDYPYNNNLGSQSVVTINLDGTIAEAKKISNNNFAVDKSLLFKSRRFNPVYKIGVQNAWFENVGFCIYGMGQQNNVLWSVQYPAEGKMHINDMEVTTDTGIVIAGLKENYQNTVETQAFLIKTTSTGSLNSCPGNSIGIAITDYNVSVENYPLLSSPTTIPGNLDANDIFVLPGSDFNLVLTCTGETNGKLGKITGDNLLCASGTGIYKAARAGTSIQPIQYSVSPTSANINILSDSSVSINFPASGTYVLYASMPSACKVLKDSMVINVLSSPGVLNLGPDTILCSNNKIILNAKKGYLTYTWQDGSVDSVFTVTAPGKYYVDVTGVCGESYSDTILVKNETVFFTPLINRVKCNTDTVHLNAPAAFYNYRWLQQNNPVVLTTQNIVVNPATTTNYFLSAEKKPGCLVFDTVIVTVLNSPPVQLGIDTGFCKGNFVTLNAGNNYIDYKWSSGSNAALINITAQGTYWVKTIYNNGCNSADTITVIQYPQPSASLGNNTVLCNGTPRILKTTQPFIQYLWQDGSSGQTYTANLPGSYSVIITDINGCTANAGITLTASDCIPFIIIPNAFTPNNDSKNDILKPVITGNLLQYRFVIMNRWGQKVFETQDPLLGWDGKFMGLPQDRGGYIWICEYQFTGKLKQLEKGNFLLIR
jgi:gliding motility-associated-like protein